MTGGPPVSRGNARVAATTHPAERAGHVVPKRSARSGTVPMFVFVLVLMLALLAILGPLAGSDSRDGLDWTPGHFWLRRPSRSHRPAAAPAGRHRQGNAPESALKSAPTGAPIDDARRALSADAPSGARTSCQGACVA